MFVGRKEGREGGKKRERERKEKKTEIVNLFMA